MENTLENPSTRYNPGEQDELTQLTSMIRELDSISLPEIEEKRAQSVHPDGE